MITITKEFITKEEEHALLSHIKPSRITVGIGRNQIIRLGSNLPYKGPMKSKAIPEWLMDIVTRVGEEWMKIKSIPGVFPDHVTINEYHKGQSIDWHIDSKGSGEIITVLSLESDALMGLKDDKGQEEQIAVPARSLLQMTDEDRWVKKHCIYPVPEHRYSLVFRKGTKV